MTTAITAVRHQYGGLAVGNVLGANILNILLVTGASAMLSPGGIAVTGTFYQVHFPALIIVQVFFSFFAYNGRKKDIHKTEGLLLISLYTLYIIVNLYSIMV